MSRKERKSPWVEKHLLHGSTGNYTIGKKADGTWGCSCPKWKFQKGVREDCQHISYVRRALALLPRCDAAVVGVPESPLGNRVTAFGLSGDTSDVVRRVEALTLVPRKDWVMQSFHLARSASHEPVMVGFVVGECHVRLYESRGQEDDI